MSVPFPLPSSRGTCELPCLATLPLSPKWLRHHFSGTDSCFPLIETLFLGPPWLRLHASTARGYGWVLSLVGELRSHPYAAWSKWEKNQKVKKEKPLSLHQILQKSLSLKILKIRDLVSEIKIMDILRGRRKVVILPITWSSCHFWKAIPKIISGLFISLSPKLKQFVPVYVQLKSQRNSIGK